MTQSSRRAVVVDDSRVIRAIVSRSLGELGFEIVEAVNGSEALQKIGEGELPAIVMIDWNMPEMSGLELVRAVRARPEWKQLRMIMITSENEHERVQEALQSGADEYIMKPFTKDMIREKLMLLDVPLPTA
jgi:two-component system chemotaxis response regulator CheY